MFLSGKHIGWADGFFFFWLRYFVAVRGICTGTYPSTARQSCVYEQPNACRRKNPRGWSRSASTG